MLHAKPETIREMAKYIEAFLADEVLCVVGNEEVIASEKALFTKVESLFSE